MERDKINYLNSRKYWVLKGARGVYPKDHNEIVRMRKRMTKGGFDPGLLQLLGPECLLESDKYGSSWQHLHTGSAYEKWLKEQVGKSANVVADDTKDVVK